MPGFNDDHDGGGCGAASPLESDPLLPDATPTLSSPPPRLVDIDVVAGMGDLATSLTESLHREDAFALLNASNDTGETLPVTPEPSNGNGSDNNENNARSHHHLLLNNTHRHTTTTAMTDPTSQCPHLRGGGGGGSLTKNKKKDEKKKKMTVRDWWPDSLDLRILHQDPIDARPKHVPHPTSRSSYASMLSEELDWNALREDLRSALTTSNPAWPADYGHYGPLMIRLAWHSAGTYRSFDGRGGGNSGNIRLAPLNSWPDNANLDKARRYVLWPVKRKYGRSISWADLIILAGNVAIESMMGPWGTIEPLWFGGGRIDAFAPEEDVYWGHEREWLEDDRHDEAASAASSDGDSTGLEKSLGAVQMGLIYVNPEGPGGNPDILASARDIRETFSRMGMSDLETVALIAGGHTFGKAHGAADPSSHVGAAPEGAPMEEMGLGWRNSFGTGRGKDTVTSGLEGAWTAHPTKWDDGYFDLLFRHEWTQSKSPGGATQWVPDPRSIEAHGGADAVANVPDAHDGEKRHLPIMFTTDLALRYDPIYGPISEGFHRNPDRFTDAFKRAWYKLCHRDMGPKSRHLGPYVPEEDLPWLDPIPAASHATIDAEDVRRLRGEVLDAVRRSDVSVSDLVGAAWASASTYRQTDHRGGANGGRVRLEPQRSWEANNPTSLARVVGVVEGIQRGFDEAQARNGSGKRVSFADLIILAGNTAIEEAARCAGHGDVVVPFVPGRTDASQSETDVDSFDVLRPRSDGFRNYHEGGGADDGNPSPESSLIDRAHLLTLTPPEMVVLVGGLRVLNANSDRTSRAGVLTDRPGVLGNDFFVNLLDDSTVWSPVAGGDKGTSPVYEGRRSGGKSSWRATRVDLAMGSNSQLRAISEAYACADSETYFVRDFVNAWVKVTMLDRFNLLNAKTETVCSKRHVSRL